MTGFLADENVSHFVIDELVAAGFDVAAVSALAPGGSDDQVRKLAAQEGRVLITEDRDFGELAVRQQLALPGIVLLELDRLSNLAEAALVAAVLVENQGRLQGNLLVIEPTRIRIRPLRPTS